MISQYLRSECCDAPIHADHNRVSLSITIRCTRCDSSLGSVWDEVLADPDSWDVSEPARLMNLGEYDHLEIHRGRILYS